MILVFHKPSLWEVRDCFSSEELEFLHGFEKRVSGAKEQGYAFPSPEEVFKKLHTIDPFIGTSFEARLFTASWQCIFETKSQLPPPDYLPNLAECQRYLSLWLPILEVEEAKQKKEKQEFLKRRTSRERWEDCWESLSEIADNVWPQLMYLAFIGGLFFVHPLLGALLGAFLLLRLIFG
jgi:hypothetical protein